MNLETYYNVISSESKAKKYLSKKCSLSGKGEISMTELATLEIFSDYI